MKTFLQLQEIRQQVNPPADYRGWIEVLGFSLQNFATVAQPSKPLEKPKAAVEHTMDLSIRQDQSTPALQLASTGGTLFAAAIMRIVEDNFAPKVTIYMHNVVVSSFRTGAGGSPNTPLASITLDYEEIVTDSIVPPNAPAATPKARFGYSMRHG